MACIARKRLWFWLLSTVAGHRPIDKLRELFGRRVGTVGNGKAATSLIEAAQHHSVNDTDDSQNRPLRTISYSQLGEGLSQLLAWWPNELNNPCLQKNLKYNHFGVPTDRFLKLVLDQGFASADSPETTFAAINLFLGDEAVSQLADDKNIQDSPWQQTFWSGAEWTSVPDGLLDFDQIIVGGRFHDTPTKTGGYLAKHLLTAKNQHIQKLVAGAEALSNNNFAWLTTFSQSELDTPDAHVKGLYHHHACEFGKATDKLGTLLNSQFLESGRKTILWFNFGLHKNQELNVQVATTVRDSLSSSAVGDTSLWHVVFTSTDAIVPTSEGICYTCDQWSHAYAFSKLRQLAVLANYDFASRDSVNATVEGTGPAAAEFTKPGGVYEKFYESVMERLNHVAHMVREVMGLSVMASDMHLAAAKGPGRWPNKFWKIVIDSKSAELAKAWVFMRLTKLISLREALFKHLQTAALFIPQ